MGQSQPWWCCPECMCIEMHQQFETRWWQVWHKRMSNTEKLIVSQSSMRRKIIVTVGPRALQSLKSSVLGQTLTLTRQSFVSSLILHKNRHTRGISTYWLLHSKSSKGWIFVDLHYHILCMWCQIDVIVRHAFCYRMVYLCSIQSTLRCRFAWKTEKIFIPCLSQLLMTIHGLPEAPTRPYCM